MTDILEKFTDDRGELIVLDKIEKIIPFQIKRIYFLKANEGSKRGFHSHKTLKQFFILLSGSVEFFLIKIYYA